MSALLQFLSRVSIGVFLTGVLGSAIVVVVSFFEDIELLFEKDDEPAVDAATTRA
jgi:hypothetical protein